VCFAIEVQSAEQGRGGVTVNKYVYVVVEYDEESDCLDSFVAGVYSSKKLALKHLTAIDDRGDVVTKPVLNKLPVYVVRVLKEEGHEAKETKQRRRSGKGRGR
jgi:hypothetical protein